MSYSSLTHRELFYDSITMHWQDEQEFYKSLEHDTVQISFEYNFLGFNNDLALVTCFDIGPWKLWHTSVKRNPPSEQIIIHNPKLWPVIYMNAHCYNSAVSEDNNHLIAYYDAVNDKVQKDVFLRRKRELFEQCAQGVSLTNLSYEDCLNKVTLLIQSFNDMLNDFGRYF